MLHEAIKAHLEADTSVFSLMGTRFFYLIIPQRTQADAVARMPCVVFDRQGVGRQVTYCGTDGMIETTVSLNVYALTYTAVRQLAQEVRRSLIDFRGTLGGILFVRAASLSSEFDIQDIEPGLFRVVQTWSFWHEEE